MQFTLATITALLSLTSAAAVTKRYPATLVERQSEICSDLTTPLCCQTDVSGVANLNCESAGAGIETTEDFMDVCALDGKTAQCCVLPAGADALLCTAA